MTILDKINSAPAMSLLRVLRSIHKENGRWTDEHEQAFQKKQREFEERWRR